MEFEREQEEAAAEEARRIGGDPYERERGEEGDPLDYGEPENRPAGQTPGAGRPVKEGGGGGAGGFEESEAELVERSENPHGPSPIAAAGAYDEEEAALD